jgi:hypothetical protein
MNQPFGELLLDCQQQFPSYFSHKRVQWIGPTPPQGLSQCSYPPSGPYDLIVLQQDLLERDWHSRLVEAYRDLRPGGLLLISSDLSHDHLDYALPHHLFEAVHSTPGRFWGVKKLGELIFLSAQPHTLYFRWQLEVQITNFREHGVSHHMQVLVWHPPHYREEGWEELERKYPEVQFFYYTDQGADIGTYVPVLRPHILAQHFERFPHLAGHPIFYHDADIIFNYRPQLDQLLSGTTSWCSDASSYQDYNYLSHKEREGHIPPETVVAGLARLTGTPIEEIRRHAGNSGGAQYILKGVDAAFWKEVEEDALKIRRYLCWDYPHSINRTYFKDEDTGFQSWCADMWALSFNMWKRKLELNVSYHLRFSWATTDLDKNELFPIYHNAGAGQTTPEMFYKFDWAHTSPIGKNLSVLPIKAVYRYVEAINKVQ